MYQGKLKKIQSTHSNLRTSEMDGTFTSLPTEGERFMIIGESLTEGNDARTILTTRVKQVQPICGNRYVFLTENSEYELEVF